MVYDKQLRDVKLARVLAKRKLDQALNAKEFAVLAGISYSTARSWFRQPGFPVICGVVFWKDFEQWRLQSTGLQRMPAAPKSSSRIEVAQTEDPISPLTMKTAQILAEAD